MELAALPSDIYILSSESVHKEVADTTDLTYTVQHLLIRRHILQYVSRFEKRSNFTQYVNNSYGRKQSHG